MSPADLALQDTVLQRLVKREDLTTQAYDVLSVWNAFFRGQVGQALTESERLGVDPGVMANILARAMSLGYPIPDSALRQHLAPRNLPTNPPPGRLLNTGLYLIEQEEGQQLAEVIRRLRSAVDTTRPGGPSVGQIDAIVQELRGYRALRSDSLQRAKRRLSRSNESYITGAIWRGDLYRKLGDLEEAEGWYLVAWWHPLAHERLGRVYEEMGRPEKAAAAYERFITAWAEADPELQGRVGAARQRLDALRDETDVE